MFPTTHVILNFDNILSNSLCRQTIETFSNILNALLIDENDENTITAFSKENRSLNAVQKREDHNL